jgi:hypothetical protein
MRLIVKLGYEKVAKLTIYLKLLHFQNRYSTLVLSKIYP